MPAKKLEEAQKAPPRLKQTDRVEIVRAGADGWAQFGLVAGDRPVVVTARESVTVSAKPAGSTALQPRWPDKEYDGYFMGADGPYAPGTRLAEMRGVRPSDGRIPTHKIVYVNGIRTSRAEHMGSLRAIADKGGVEVIGVYNASDGLIKDAWQTGGDKLNRGDNRAYSTLKRLLSAELTDPGMASRSIHLMAHSQGAATLSRALTDVRLGLKATGVSPAEVDRRLSRLNVETFGGASWSFVDGPRYHHYVNALDPVPKALGTGARLGLGKDARVTEFVSVRDAPMQHSFQEVYLRRWHPQPPKTGS